MSVLGLTNQKSTTLITVEKSKDLIIEPLSLTEGIFEIKNKSVLIQYNECITPQEIKGHFQSLAKEMEISIKECIVVYKNFTLIFLKFNKELVLNNISKLHINADNALAEPCKILAIPNKRMLPTIKEWLLLKLQPDGISTIIPE